MKQFLLATALIAVAVGAFFGGRAYLVPTPVAAVANPLGDLSAMAAIVTDVQGIASSGDLGKAKARIKDLETAWDDAQPVLQPKDPEAWGRIDGAADDALSALRTAPPDAGEVETALAALQVALADPAASGPGGGVQMVGGVAVTDAGGHPLPCEAMLKDITAKRDVVKLAPEAVAKIDDLVAKATERCNADDDKTADGFSAQALQALSAN